MTTTADIPKNVTKKRHDFTKPEREYVKGIVHNLSLQRLTDQEIVQWLHDEKQIDLDRSTVSKMSNQIERSAEKWYIDLRNSAYKYLAQYKERIDSLLSYQKTLHEIISSTKRDEVKIRAISELHSIEMDILSLWKQLPASNVVNTVDTENEEGKGKKVQWAVQIGGQEEEVKEEESEINSEAWTIDAHPTPTLAETVAPTLTSEIQETVTIQEPESTPAGQFTPTVNNDYEKEQEQEPEQKKDTVDIEILGRWPKPFDIEPWVQCKFNNSNCNKWFKNKEIRSRHIAKYHT